MKVKFFFSDISFHLQLSLLSETRRHSMHSQRNSRTNNEPRSRSRPRRKSGNRRGYRSRSDSRLDRALHRGLVPCCRLRQNSRFQSRTRSVRSLRRERVEMCTGQTKNTFFLWTLSRCPLLYSK